MSERETPFQSSATATQQRWQELFLDATYHLNKTKAQDLLDQAFLHIPPEEVCLALIQPVMYQIGHLWHTKQISWINENFASTLIYTTLLRYIQELPQGQIGPEIYMSGVPEETHEIGLLMLALFWKRRGLRITYVSQIKTSNQLFQEIEKARPALVCLSAMTTHRARSLVPISQAIKQLPAPQPILCYGGGAFLQQSPLQQEIYGFYLGPNAAVATQQLQLLLQRFR